MSVEAPSKQRQEKEMTNGSILQLQREQIMDQYRSYFEETFREKKVAGAKETAELEQWARTQKATEGGVKSLRDFFEGHLKNNLASGRSLHSHFHSSINLAAQNKWISQRSYQKWVERFENPSAEYKDREKWVKEDMPAMMERWKKVAEQRDTLIKNPRFKDLVSADPTLAIMLDREKFLDAHFIERQGYVSRALALMNAKDTSRLDLYNAAKSKLESAANNDYILNGKVGVWLERIFKSKAHPKKIAEFVNGTGLKSLEGLIQSWTDVKLRFDTVTQKAKERGQDSAARGFTMITSSQFLAMHYAKRLSYVKQAEERLNDAKNIENEVPIFLRIRHAMDIKDWHKAKALIAEAKLMRLKDSDWPRLISMQNHVAKFTGKASGNTSVKVAEKQKRLHELVSQLESSHSEMVPLVKRLLSSPNPNRGIHQLRWIAYNNIWTRTHGGPYLDDEIARQGASSDQVQLTKHRAENGLDIGRHDALDYETADSAYFRKQEMSKHKATFLHTNMNSGGVVSALGEKLEHEQPPQWLYWTTLCPHLNGEPKTEAWMREFLQILTEMRSLTRGTGDEAVTLRPKAMAASEVSYEMKA